MNNLKRNIESTYDDTARGYVDEAQNYARRGLERVTRAAGDTVDSAREYSRDAVNAVGSTVRNQPGLSLGMSIGVGVLIGILVERYFRPSESVF